MSSYTTKDDTIMKPIIFTDYTFHIITAHSFPEFGIGSGGKLPWNYKNELKHFKTITTKHWLSDDNIDHTVSYTKKNIVVFGRKTWNGISNIGKKSILKDRVVVVISSNEKGRENHNSGTEYWCHCENLVELLYKFRNNLEYSRHVFFAGGEMLYKHALNDFPISCAHITEVYLTKEKNKHLFDTFFPTYKPHQWVVPSHCPLNNEDHHRLCLYECSLFIKEKNTMNGNNGWYRHKTYASSAFLRDYRGSFKTAWISEESQQYLAIMDDIMEKGVDREDRTGTGTRAVFSSRQVYDLTDTFPIITTRRQWLKGIFEELKLYISGKTDNKILQEKGIHIWDGNTSRKFLDSRGLDNYPDGDMGETYGFNFRHFGGVYETCNSVYKIGEHGFDQLNNVIELLKNDPTSRRIIINLWNPATTHKAALPSCLMMYQFFVDTVANKLNCQIYIRSSDYFLANNWNCCTGALLVHMLCALKDIPYTPGFISIVTGDTHIYKTHFKQVRENLLREPAPFPKMEINSSKTYSSLNDIDYDDLFLIGYQPQASISAPMSV